MYAKWKPFVDYELVLYLKYDLWNLFANIVAKEI